MIAGSIKGKWLLNFSSSWTGGGLKRLEETAKWFDSQEGAVFLVNYRALSSVSRYSQRNSYISIKQNKIKRFIADGKYLSWIINEIGIPDVYFSYGIPVFYKVGRLNWLHISNALTLTPAGHNMSLLRQFEHRVLGRRLLCSMRDVQIASAESEFSLDLLKNAKSNNANRCMYIVLENGCEVALFNMAKSPQPLINDGNYAITVGTAPYKRIKLAHAIFRMLHQMHPDMNRFKIVGDQKLIPMEVMNDDMVDAIGSGLTNDDLYSMLRSAKYYISASRIENSSIAALEGLLLSHNTALSDIPPHREICRNLIIEKMKMSDDDIFILVDGDKNRGLIKPLSWDAVLHKMNDIVANYKTDTQCY